MAMDKKLKAKWVKALRSGNYKQGLTCLQLGDGRNCCLGVLCRVARADFNPNDGYPSQDEDCNERPFLGLSVKAQKKLVNMNDGTEGERTHTFKEIADYIEKSKRI